MDKFKLELSKVFIQGFNGLKELLGWTNYPHNLENSQHHEQVMFLVMFGISCLQRRSRLNNPTFHVSILVLIFANLLRWTCDPKS